MWEMYEAEQQELKIAANSLYGLLGTTTSEISCLNGAYSITAWGSAIIQKVQKAIEARFNGKAREAEEFISPIDPKFNRSDPAVAEGDEHLQVVYGDTDSLMFRLIGIKELQKARVLAHKIHHWIHHQSGLLHGKLEMEIEPIAMKFLLLEKKHYVKLQYPPELNGNNIPEMKKSGIETRSLCRYVADTSNEILEAYMFDGKKSADLERLIRLRVKNLYRGKIDSLTLLKHSAKLTKPLEEYENDEKHTVAARQMLYDGLQVNEGDRIEYYFCYVLGNFS